MRETFSAVQGAFPGAVPLIDFVDGQTRWLANQGFLPETSLAVLASCRDELAAGLRAEVRRQWDFAFDFASLSGLPLAGATGARAVRDHAPERAGRVQIVIWALPHVGVLDDGTVGQVMRRGRHHPTTACGSLHAAATWAADSRGDPLAGEQPIDPRDPEQSLVRRRLLSAYPGFDTFSPKELVERVVDLMLADLWDLIDTLTNPHNVDAAIVSGVLVHGSAGDFVAPRLVRLRRIGKTIELSASAATSDGDATIPQGVSG